MGFCHETYVNLQTSWWGQWKTPQSTLLCKLFGHAEKGTEDWDQICASMLEKWEALSYYSNKTSFCTHPGAQLCPPSDTALPCSLLPACSSSPCLWLHWLLCDWKSRKVFACDPVFVSSLLPVSSYLCSAPSTGVSGGQSSEMLTRVKLVVRTEL